MILYYDADRNALLENAETQEDITAINNRYDAYVKYVEHQFKEVIIDYDSTQSTYCNSGNMPEMFVSFWEWYS